MSDLTITRSMTIEGDHYATTVEVADVAQDDDSGPAVMISQTADETTDEPDVIALAWSEWRAIADHVSLVEETYGNPDAGTAAYAADRVELVPAWFKQSLRDLVTPGGEVTIPRYDERAGRAQCRATNTQDEPCWLPEGHRPVRWRGGGNSAQHVAGHVNVSGELFWAAV